jgi:hypothetical protein
MTGYEIAGKERAEGRRRRDQGNEVYLYRGIKSSRKRENPEMLIQ